MLFKLTELKASSEYSHKNTDIKGTILENGLIKYGEDEKSLNLFVKEALGWSSVKPYILAIHEQTSKSLSHLRLEYMKK